MSETDNKSGNPGTTDRRGHTAGALDIRTFIALLIGIYGGVLVITGLVGTSDAELARADGMNINLLAGIGMVVVAAGFVLWARLRPVVVPDETAEERETATEPAGERADR